MTGAAKVRRCGRLLRASIAGLLALCLLGVTARGSVAAAPPALEFTSAPGHMMAASGMNWGGHLVVTARIGSAAGSVVLDSLTGGAFTVGIDFTVACGGLTVEARDFRGDDITIHHMGPMCPNRFGDPPPTVVILQGKARTQHVTSLRHAAGPRALSLRLGDALVITEPGGAAPAFSPTVDSRYFILVSQSMTGTGDSRWKWVAVKTGRTALSLSPACRQTRPACQLAEPLIDITIHR